MLPLQRTVNFENVLVGKPNQIEKPFTPLWLSGTGDHGSGGSLDQAVGLSAWSSCGSVVSGSRGSIWMDLETELAGEQR